MAMYDRGVALRVAERSRALANFDDAVAGRSEPSRRRVRPRRVRRPHRSFLDLPVLYRNDGFAVYDLAMTLITDSIDRVSGTVSLPPGGFTPRRFLAHGHVMTVFAWAARRDFPALPVPEARLIAVTSDTHVLAHCYWQDQRAACPTLVALHGLEGSSGAHYMRGLADKAYRRGWNAVLLNQRNCGGTEHLTPTLYHSGLTADPREVMRALASSDGLRAFGVVGYSLGGNLALKLAGELRATPDVPASGGRRDLSDDRSRALRPGDRAARELAVSLQLRAKPQGADAAQGRRVAGQFRSVGARSHLAPSAHSTTPIRRRHTGSGTRRTTTTGRAPCAWPPTSGFRP